MGGWLVVGLVGLALGHAALAWLSAEFLVLRFFGDVPFPLMWPPTGLAFAALLLGGRRLWPAVAAGALALTLSNQSWSEALVLASGATLEALLAVVLVRRSEGGRLDFRRQNDLWRFLRLACLLPPMVSALAGTLVAWGSHTDPTTGMLLEHFLRWWLSNATGMLVAAPPVLTWLGPWLRARAIHDPEAPDEGWQPRGDRRREAGVALGLSALTAVVAFGGPLDGTYLALWPPFASIPFSLWTSLRHGPREATTVSLFFAAAASWGTAQGVGPFADALGIAGAGILWPFILSMTVITLVMSVLLTEQRHAEAERQAGLDLLETIVDNLPALVAVRDEQGRNIFVNRAMTEAYARPPEELLGHTAAEIIGGELGAELTALDFKLLEGQRSEGEPGPTTASRQLDIREQVPGQSRTRHYLTTKHLLSGPSSRRLLTIAFDITDLKDAQAARERSEAQLRSVLENLDGWVLTTDLAGTLFFANRPFPDTELQEMLAMRLSSFVHSEDRFQLDAMIARSVSEGRRRTLEVRAAWGQQPWIECRISPVYRRGEVHELMITLVDVEDRRRAERERLRLREQMQKMRNLESLGALAGGIAHDFNNLLTAVLGNAAMAAGQVEANSRAHRSLQRIEGAAERAAELCQQMLDFAGKARLEKSPQDLSNLVHSMVEALRGALAETTTLDLDLGVDLPRVLCDPTQIRRIVMNLITNASDALEEKPGAIRIHTAQRDLDVKALSRVQLGQDLRPGRYVVLEVRDEGCGMSPEVRDQIFEPFFTTKFAGRGLGLAAVGGTMRSHGGGILVESAPGQGTAFTLLFQATHLDTAPAPSPTPKPAESFSGGRVLVADDQEVVRALARSALEDAGFTVVLARDGEEACKLIDQHRDTLRIAVLDHSMPGVSGLEIIQQLDASGTRLPCLLSSGFDPSKLTNDVGSANEIAFLRKPYRPADLVREVRRILERESSAPNLETV